MLEKIQFYIEPRGSGKTTKLLQLFNNYYNSCFISYKMNDYWIKRNFPRYNIEMVIDDMKGRLLSQHFTIDDIRGRRFENIFIDDYLFFDSENINKCNQFLPMIAKNIIIRTTPSVLIDENIYNLVKFAREKGITRYLSKDSVISYLLNNLITHPKTNLIQNSEYVKDLLSNEDYKTQILGILFDDD
jgi:hypothetical protein